MTVTKSQMETVALLRAAVLRIGVRLDLDTVLREVVDSARALTGARYGSSPPSTATGSPATSSRPASRLTSTARWRRGPTDCGCSGHLRELPAPLRLPDLDAWTRSFGCSPFTVSSGAFQATPMRHRRPAAAGFFLRGRRAGFDALSERDRPRYQLLSHFQTFELLDRDEDEETRFAFTDLPQHKVIEPLFLDDPRAEFRRLLARRDGRAVAELRSFRDKLGSLRLFDPACGCGNFLIIAYRELRTLEIDVLREIASRASDGRPLQTIDQ